MANMDISKCLFAYLVFLLLCFCLHFSHASMDTISHGQLVTTSGTIISVGQKFELGFFRPGNSTNYYLGIWYSYKEVAKQTVVWVGNRVYPFNSSSAVLTIGNDGNLVISQGRISYGVSNVSSNGNTSATLLDSGNLVLRDEKSNILWQSFDFPTDTLLPGMKIGYDKRNGKTGTLVPWRSKEDPSPGVFCLQADPNGTKQIFIMKGSETLYWTSGPWDGKIFSLIPEMRSNYLYNITYVGGSDGEESYFEIDVYDKSSISRFVMDVKGQFQKLDWMAGPNQWFLIWEQPSSNCNVYAFCGAFASCNAKNIQFCKCFQGFEPRFSGNYSAGCARKTSLQCENTSHAMGDGDGFAMLSKVLLPVNPIDPGTVGSAGDCKLVCLNNCSCTAYTYIDSVCSIWVGDLISLIQLSDDDSAGTDLYYRLAASELSKSSGIKTHMRIIVILAISLTVLLVAFFICGIWMRKYKRKGEDLLSFDFSISPGAAKYGLIDKKIAGRGRKKEVELPLFSFSSVSAATDNFSAANKLGEGGFGPVYKGSLLKGQLVAVKRLSRKSGQGWEELKNEAMLIAKLQHKNLVKLLGCCIERDEKILIYEYLPNKSLDFFLFDPIRHGIIDWGTRLHIIEGIAQGLLYLHQYSRLQIIHRDLKASNILLDKDMNPKISDFGLARIFLGNGSQATNRIVGTYGYMSPEYALEGLFSTKSDVFSFGVLLLEILSGKKNTGIYQSDSLNLIGYAWDLWKSNRALDLKDPILEDIPPANVLLRYINIALLCVQESAADRPTMSDVVSMFSNEHALILSPKQPAFSNVKSTENPNVPRTSSEICSLNEMTNSILEAR